MFLGPWCGGMGAGGWLVMVLFWGTLLGLAIWAVTRLGAPVPRDRAADDPRAALDHRLAVGDIDLDTYRRLRDELAVAGLEQEDRSTRRTP